VENLAATCCRTVEHKMWRMHAVWQDRQRHHSNGACEQHASELTFKISPNRTLVLTLNLTRHSSTSTSACNTRGASKLTLSQTLPAISANRGATLHGTSLLYIQTTSSFHVAMVGFREAAARVWVLSTTRRWPFICTAPRPLAVTAPPACSHADEDALVEESGEGEQVGCTAHDANWKGCGSHASPIVRGTQSNYTS